MAFVTTWKRLKSLKEEKDGIPCQNDWGLFKLFLSENE